VSTTLNGDATVFGVHFADGRIKGYPRDLRPNGSVPAEFVRYVRGNPDYDRNACDRHVSRLVGTGSV